MMRLRRLDLTRFGHFTNRQIDLGPVVAGRPDFHIIYGPNEAGKTTLMEAYLRLIYGFPMRDGYGFKHPLTTLQVGGVLDIDGVATEVVRVKKAANSLLDRHGDAVPEAVLQHCLGGILQDDYRKLFCLDDATIEAGGEEITNSKGDIGRLLFAAAAGIGDLTGVLDQVAARAEAFYKKSASKTAFAGLKRNLDAVAAEIKALDIPASHYHNLRGGVVAAEAVEAAARVEKEAHERRSVQLGAVIAAHPIAADLRKAENDLAPISHYPTALDIDPEALVALMTARVALEAVRDREALVIAQAQAGLDQLDVRADILGLGDAIQALDVLRGRMEGAVSDLPKRQEEQAAALQEMRAKLVEIGLEPGGDPTRFVLPEPVLARLEQQLRKWREAQAVLAGAVTEQRAAETAARISAAEVVAAEAAVTIGPEVSDVLTQHGAAQCVEANRMALHQIEAARRAAADRLRDLARGAVSFAGLPSVGVSARQAEALAADVLKSDQGLAALRAAKGLAVEKAAKAAARLGVLTSDADLVTDDLAAVLRGERDARWAVHRAALDAGSADAFADALRRDDSATALRQAQTREIAEYLHARLAESEAAAELAAATTRLGDAVAARAVLDAQVAGQLAAVGLGADLTAADLADWVRQHAAALAAKNDLQSVEDSTTVARDQAQALRLALAALPGLGGDTLEALYRMALAQSEARAVQLAAVQRKRDAQDKDAADLAKRQASLREAQIGCDAAQTAWQAEASAALPAEARLTHFHDALPSLRGLREINETLKGLVKQIAGMRRDQAEFEAAMAPVAAVLGLAAALPLPAYRQARAALTAAEAAAGEWRSLTARLEAAQSAHAGAVAQIAIQDAQIRQLAGAFEQGIATETLQDLRAAVTVGQRAIDLRAGIAKLTTALLTRLNVANRAAAEEVLDAQPLEAAEAALAAIAGDGDRLGRAVEAAIEARSTAKSALERVQGDADVATRVAAVRTIEVEMQDGALRYLEDRFAHLLAERAIRRYRDTHRGGMLVATEVAFRALTNGAYAALSTQTEGASETLVAIQANSGSAKQAREMSKGTKFQLYLALRAAAYEQMASNGTILPFFCDDIFETFDEGRTTAACGLLRQIGQRGQAIYLTHHKHVVDIACDLCGNDVQVHDLVE